MLKKGDVFFTRGAGVISKIIRFCTREAGEEKTQINHIGIIVQDGSLHEAIGVEALHEIERHKIGDYYKNTKNMIAVYRPTNLTSDEIDIVVRAAESQVGKKYGYLKLGMHLLDWLLGGARVFRFLLSGKSHPICSWLVAYAFAQAGKNFGMNENIADPDEIWDYVNEYNRNKYICVHKLAPFKK